MQIVDRRVPGNLAASPAVDLYQTSVGLDYEALMIFKSKYTQVLELLKQFSEIFHGVVNNHGEILNALIKENIELKTRISELERRLNES